MTKARVYTLDHRHVQALLVGGAKLINLPPDAQVVDYRPNLRRKGLDLQVVSAQFPDIPEGRDLPRIAAQVEVISE